MLARDNAVIGDDPARVTFERDGVYTDQATGKPVAAVTRYTYTNAEDRYVVSFTRTHDLSDTPMIDSIKGIKRIAARLAHLDGGANSCRLGRAAHAVRMTPRSNRSVESLSIEMRSTRHWLRCEREVSAAKPPGGDPSASRVFDHAGLRVLAAWLASEPDPPRLQIESMLRLGYADQGSKQDLLAAVRSIRRWVLAQAPAGLWHIRGYLDPEEENATQFPPAGHHCPFHLVLCQRVRTDDHLGGPG